MTLDQETRNGIEIIRIKGRLDSATSPELERLVLERLETPCERMVLDLTDLDYVSSAGLRVILLAGKQLRARHGKLVLVGLRDVVRDVFEMSGFLALFPVTATMAEALV
jgi:anti-anti-sigma factor